MTATHSPFVLPNLDISSFIRDMAGFAIIKDLHSNYLNANLNTVNEFGLKNSDHLLGYSDLTIPHPLSHNGQFYRNLDLEVIQTGEPMKGICTFPFHGSIRPYHFKKSILKDTYGNKIGTYSHAEECSDPSIIQFIQYLIAEHPFTFNQTNKPNSFILNKEYRGIKLSPLEAHCLFYLIRKKTKSDIANILHLPLKTINSYIENIKIQLNANTMRDIVEIAILNGYLNNVPPGIVQPSYPIQQQLKLINNNQVMHLEGRLLSTHFHSNKPVKFTHREMDCANLLLKGYRIKEMAAIMHVSPRTIETHINNLKIKLSCRDKIELIIKLKDIFNANHPTH